MKLLLLDRPLDKSIIYRRDIEFFGPWAQPINTPEDLLKPRFEPYPTWESVYNAGIRIIEEADNIYESLLKILPDLTGLNCSRRFWRVYLGDFIITLVTAVEDIKNREAALPEKADYILGFPDKGDIKNSIPNCWKEAEEYMFRSDYFNWRVMDICLNGRFSKYECIKYEFVPFKKIAKIPKGFCAKLLCRNGHKKFINKLQSIFMTGFPNGKGLLRGASKSLLWDKYNLNDFDFRDIGHTSVLNNYSIGVYALPLFHLDKIKRDVIKNSFTKPYGELLSLCLPLFALEGLAALIDLIKKKGLLKEINNIRRIYTHGQAFNSNGLSRVLFALTADMGKKIISVQHGGGAYIAHTGMYMERTIADEYITWGAGYTNYNELPQVNKIRHLPSIYLSNLKQKYNSKTKNKKERFNILFLVLEEFRYVKWMYSALFADMAYDYFNRQKILFDYFSKEKKAAVKVYYDTYGWKQVEWFKARYPSVKLLTSGRFVDYACESKFVIIDYNSTAFLEMLILNKPFFLTWNRRWPKGVNLFENYIDKLIKAGIFYEDPGALIKEYDRLAPLDINEWWNEKSRQDLISEVAGLFALTSDNFRECWKNEFEG